MLLLPLMIQLETDISPSMPIHQRDKKMSKQAIIGWEFLTNQQPLALPLDLPHTLILFSLHQPMDLMISSSGVSMPLSALITSLVLSTMELLPSSELEPQ